MLKVSRIARRGLELTACALALLAAGLLGVLLYPEPLYAYSVQHGRLSLHSDSPFRTAAGREVLADVERRLSAAPEALADPHSEYRVFVSNAEWRRRTTFLWSYGAGGVNHYPIAHTVFLRQADINRDRLLSSNGDHVAPPRTLSYFASHEIAHSLIGKRIGAIGNWRLPEWIREGLADYVGVGGDVAIEDLVRGLREGDRQLDPAASGLYLRYLLLVAFFLDHEGWSVDVLLASGMSQENAERQLLEAIR